MDANTPITLATARYSDRDGAVNDFKAVWDARKGGEFDHTAVAVLTKDESGKLQVERHDSTAKHLTWGGALLGAALVDSAWDGLGWKTILFAVLTLGIARWRS